MKVDNHRFPRFDGYPVVIVAGGPSLTLAQVRFVGMARSKDKCRVIAVNDAIYPCWFADLLHSSDERWWKYHSNVPTYCGKKTSVQWTEFSDVHTLDPETFSTGDDGQDIWNWKNSGAQAVHLAAKLGAKRILLLGIDYSGCRETKDGTRDHWFGRHVNQPEFRMDINSDVKEIKRLFRILTNHLHLDGVEIVNCSPESTVDWLLRSTIEKEFQLV